MSAPAPTVTPELKALLRRVKLGRVLDTLPERLALAKTRNLAHTEFLELVLADEVTRRDTSSAALRARTAGLDPSMTRESWDDSTAVTFDRPMWDELCSLRFIEAANNVMVMGPVGVGKTFLASALGHAAVRRRYRVETYNHSRDHQSLGDRPPVERFRLAAADSAEFVAPEPEVFEEEAPSRQRVSRGVDTAGRVSLGGHRYHVGRWLALESVELALRDGLVGISHRGVVVATHAQRHPKGKEPAALRERPSRRRPAPKAATVRRKVDGTGAISFAGATYRVGNAHPTDDG